MTVPTMPLFCEGTGWGRRPCTHRRRCRSNRHWRVEIERDAGGVAFAHAAEDEIVADFIAAADATVAEDAGVMIDSNGKRRVVLAAGERVRFEKRGLFYTCSASRAASSVCKSLDCCWRAQGEA